MSIGEDIGALRADKNVTVTQLTAAADMSEATYNRILTGHAEPKLPTFLAMMAALRVDMADYSAQFHDANMPFYHAWQDTLASLTAPKPKFSALRQRLTRANATHPNAGYAILLGRVDLAEAVAARDTARARAVATALFAQLAETAPWGDFEFTLVAPLVAYLPFNQVMAIYNRLQPLTGAAFAPHDQPLEQPFDTILVTGLQNALATGTRPNVDAAVTAIMARSVRTENIYFQMIQQVVAQVVTPALNGHLAAAKAAYADLIGALHFLIAAPDNAAYTTLGRLWSGLQQFLQAQENPS